MFALSEDETMLRDAARAFVSEQSPTDRLRRIRDAGESHDAALLGEMASLGWTGILVPEAYGGTGLGHRGMGLVLEECGRTLAPAPLLSAAMIGPSAYLLGRSHTARDEALPRIAEGGLVCALAIDEGPHHDPRRIETVAARDGDGWRVSGAKSYVADGHLAGRLLVAARIEGEGVGLVQIPREAQGLGLTALRTVDSRGAAKVTLEDVGCGPDDVIGVGEAFLDAVLDRARIGVACELMGLAEQAFAVTSDYLKTRVQFGQVIGAFQGLQHRAAKLMVELELTRSCVMAALAALDDGANAIDVARSASLAKARTAETAHLATNEMVQMHGGIGMTDAHDAGLFLKRARVCEALYGSASFHRDRYATLGGY